MVRDFPPRTWVSPCLYQRCRELRLFFWKKKSQLQHFLVQANYITFMTYKMTCRRTGNWDIFDPIQTERACTSRILIVSVFSPFFFSQKWICRKLLWQIMECSLRDLHHDRGRNDDFECERFFSCMCPCIYVPHLPINSPWHAFRAYPVSYICHTFPGTVKT